MLLRIFVLSFWGGARILNGNKTDVKTEYTHAGCGHEGMLNPVLQKEEDASEGVLKRKRIVPDDLSAGLWRADPSWNDKLKRYRNDSNFVFFFW